MQDRKNMGSFLKKLLAAALAAGMLAGMLSLAACGGKSTSKSNPLYGFDEIREINETLKMPYMLGEWESEVAKNGFEPSDSGKIEHHLVRYRANVKDNSDISYTLGTRELHYGEPDPSTKLYVTGFRIMPKNKEIVNNGDGTRTPVYTTSRSVLGIKVGDLIENAREKLLSLGYTVVYEQQTTPNGLPGSREHTYRKGCVMISMAVESTNDISQISVWVPYYSPEIAALNAACHLPADLGLVYSVLENEAFTYAGKTRVAKKYETEDGSVAIVRGFPDYSDMILTAEVSFTSEAYDVLGVKVGMTEEEASRMLLEKGCTQNREGVFVYNEVAAVQLTAEDGVVTRIAATLKPSTNLTNIELEG